MTRMSRMKFNQNTALLIARANKIYLRRNLLHVHKQRHKRLPLSRSGKEMHRKHKYRFFSFILYTLMMIITKRHAIYWRKKVCYEISMERYLKSIKGHRDITKGEHNCAENMPASIKINLFQLFSSSPLLLAFVDI